MLGRPGDGAGAARSMCIRRTAIGAVITITTPATTIATPAIGISSFVPPTPCNSGCNPKAMTRKTTMSSATTDDRKAAAARDPRVKATRLAATVLGFGRATVAKVTT